MIGQMGDQGKGRSVLLLAVFFSMQNLQTQQASDRLPQPLDSIRKAPSLRHSLAGDTVQNGEAAQPFPSGGEL